MSIRKLIQEKLTLGLLEKQNHRNVGGVLIKCKKTGHIFLLLRNDKQPVWALVSGTIEEGENILQGLKREVYEELKINPNIIDFKFVGTEYVVKKNMSFHYWQGFTNSEFIPILDHENLKSGWFSKDNLPIPLFKGLQERIAKI